MADKLIAQQSIIRVGSVCIIFGDENNENNGLTCVAHNVYFDDGEWWADVVHYFNEVKFIINENGVKSLLDNIAIPVSILMSIGDTELEEVV